MFILDHDGYRLPEDIKLAAILVPEDDLSCFYFNLERKKDQFDQPNIHGKNHIKDIQYTVYKYLILGVCRWFNSRRPPVDMNVI